MVFSSTIFTFLFLPIVLMVYYLSKEQYRNNILLIASLLFYAYGEPWFVILMMISIIINWGLALAIDNCKNKLLLRRLLLFFAVLINIGVLFIFKYYDFSVTIFNMIFGSSLKILGIGLPIGISFFTFQAISYIVDIYRGEEKAQKNLMKVGLYISLFPQLIAGPIVRYKTVAEQIEDRKTTADMFAQGIKRFLCGFCKKIILANNLAVVAEEIFSCQSYDSLPMGYAWIGAICFSLQIFYDFSGYSDMAIGLGKMFGFEFQENFNYPYISKSITEFWRRWHMSLGQWFRDYVYIPLGGSRSGVIRHILNMFVVWVLTGLWHGANFTFIAWGLIYFVGLVIEKYIIKPEKRKNVIGKVLWQIITLIIIIFAWVLFNSEGLKEGVQYWLAMVGVYYHNPMWGDQYYFIVKENLVYIIVSLIFTVPIAPYMQKRIGKTTGGKTIMELMHIFVYMIGFIWAISFLILGSHNPFIYFNF